jgi:hypothetical protein
MTMSRNQAFAELASLDPASVQGPDHDSGVPEVDEVLLSSIVEKPQAFQVDDPEQSTLLRALRARDRRHMAVLSCAAGIVVVGAIVAGLNTSSPGHKSSPIARPPVHLGHWALTASLTAPQFQIATGNPDAVVGVTCSQTSTCFLSTGYGLDFGGGGGMSVSHDGGHTWQASPMTDGTAVTSLASCVTDSWCAAGGGLLDPKTGDPAAKKPMRDPELLVTSDGGATWTARSVPLPVDVQQLPASGSLPAETTYWPGEVDTVSCSAVNVCNVLGQAQVNPSGSGNGDELVFLHTEDGGINWSSKVLPAIPSAASYQLVLAPGTSETMSCPTALTCVILASPVAPQTVVTWRTTDGGKTWSEHQIPGLEQIDANLSCPTAETCWAGPSEDIGQNGLLKTEDSGDTWTSVALPSFPTISTTQAGVEPNISCTSSSVCYLSLENSGLADTVDGGESWHAVPLPSSVGAVLHVSCNGGLCAAVADSVNPSPDSINQFHGGSLILTNGSGGSQ